MTYEVVSRVFRVHNILPLAWIVENTEKLECVWKYFWSGAEKSISDVPLLTLRNYVEFCSISKNDALKLSVNFRKKIPQCVIQKSEHFVLNVHQSFLPWNRGHWPEVWAILEDTPIGVSIHEVVKEWDCGDIIFQKNEVILEKDTAASLGSRLDKLATEVVVEQFPNLISKNITRIPQKTKLPLRTLEQLKNLTDLTFEQWSSLSEEQCSRLLRAAYNPPHFSSVKIRFNNGACASIKWKGNSPRK